MGLLLVVLLPMVVTSYNVGLAVTTVELLGSPVIVHVGNDEAVMTAVRTVQEYLPGVRTVNIAAAGELESLVLSNVAIFLVGHGAPGGLGTLEDVVIPWSQLTSLQQRYPATRLYVVACDAQQYLQAWNVLTTRVAYAPSGKIDAEIGALQALAKLARDLGLTMVLVPLALRLFSVVLTKPASEYQFLGPCLESCINPPPGGGSGGASASGSQANWLGVLLDVVDMIDVNFRQSFSPWWWQFVISFWLKTTRISSDTIRVSASLLPTLDVTLGLNAGQAVFGIGIPQFLKFRLQVVTSDPTSSTVTITPTTTPTTQQTALGKFIGDVVWGVGIGIINAVIFKFLSRLLESAKVTAVTQGPTTVGLIIAWALAHFFFLLTATNYLITRDWSKTAIAIAAATTTIILVAISDLGKTLPGVPRQVGLIVDVIVIFSALLLGALYGIPAYMNAGYARAF